MKKIDVLLIARPDHSYNIYRELLGSNLTFVYIVFKFFPKWLSRLVAKDRLREIDNNCSICWSMTLINTLHYNLGWKWLSIIPESFIYQPHIKRFLWRNSPQLIHYWPEYCTDLIKGYKQKHPEVKTLAEIVFLNEQFVLDENAEYLTSLGLGENLEYIKKNNEITKRVMSFENNFMVPSQLAADSFRKYYPNKNFYVLPYGIHISPKYKRKQDIPENGMVTSFVYAGTVSIEKGCDLVCELFLRHPKKELHLYGHIHGNEKNIFEKYKNVNNIVFHGAVPHTVLQEKLRQYDAGIHLSRFDSYSLSVAEMIGIGLPVIVSNRAGVCEDVRSCGFGEVVELSDSSIMEAFNRFCQPTIYNKYLEAIDLYVKQSPKTYAEKIIDFYNDCLHQ